MEVIKALFLVAEHTLSIYRTKKARKYLDRVIYLKKAYYNEQNKPENDRSHAVMDNAVHELCIITESIAELGEPGSED